MKCPTCDSESSEVVDSRKTDRGRSRRRMRQCLDCEQRFTTYEIVGNRGGVPSFASFTKDLVEAKTALDRASKHLDRMLRKAVRQ